MVFNFQRLEIPEVILVTSKSFPDERGFFLENFKDSEFTTNGIKTKFVQDNFSHSVKGVLRGLHYQKNSKAQAKLVSAFKGEIFEDNKKVITSEPEVEQKIEDKPKAAPKKTVKTASKKPEGQAEKKTVKVAVKKKVVLEDSPKESNDEPKKEEA